MRFVNKYFVDNILNEAEIICLHIVNNLKSGNVTRTI